jgi:EpsI family protein
MLKYERSNCPPVVVAALTASLLMLLSGSGYRVLAARLAAPVDTIPIAAADLERFPSQIGGWTGREVPLDKAVVRATDTDAHLSRAYLRRDNMDSVYLYIACGVKARDLMPHRPEVCYTGNGWTLADRRSIDVPLSDGSKLPCNLLQFSKGALQTEEVVILDYYIVDGQHCPDVSLLRSKAWRGSGTVQYVAQVEVISVVTAALPADSAAKLVSTFAAESASSIAQLFENRQRNQSSDESHESSKGE